MVWVPQSKTLLLTLPYPTSCLICLNSRISLKCQHGDWLNPGGQGINPDKTLKIQWADRPVDPADDPRDQDPELPMPWEDEDQDQNSGDAAGVA